MGGDSPTRQTRINSLVSTTIEDAKSTMDGDIERIRTNDTNTGAVIEDEPK